MPQGWLIELSSRRPGHTLIVRERFSVAIEDEDEALAAVEDRARDYYSVKILARNKLSDTAIAALGLKRGDIRRH